MRYAGFAFAVVLAACGGDGSYEPPPPDCAPVGDYTCSCVESLDTCGVSLDLKRSVTVDYATELCGATRRLTDSGWFEATPGLTDTCWVRSQSELQRRGNESLDAHLVVQVVCTGKAPCVVELMCLCVKDP